MYVCLYATVRCGQTVRLHDEYSRVSDKGHKYGRTFVTNLNEVNMTLCGTEQVKDALAKRV
jgi:hypothetical protein